MTLSPTALLPRLPALLLVLAGVWACGDLEQRLFKPQMKVVCHILEGYCLFENRCLSFSIGSSPCIR